MSIEYMRADPEYIEGLLWEKAAGTISNDDNRFIEQILTRDPQTRRLWTDIRERLDTEKGRTFINNLNEKQAWKKVRTRVELSESRAVSKVRTTVYWIAAAVIVVCLAVYFVDFSLPSRQLPVADDKNIRLELGGGKIITLNEVTDAGIDLGTAKLMPMENGIQLSGNEHSPAHWTTLIVPPTRDYKIVLSDGSRVWMNASSSLRFPLNFSDSIREVYLHGEGYFEVAGNRARPFVVHAGNTAVRVLGTSFNVNAYTDTAVATALVEGSILAKAGPYETILEPGYQAIYRGDHPFTTIPFDREQVLSWMDGAYHFHDQSLTELSGIMARWFNVTVIFGTETAATKKFTGTIRKHQPLNVFISNLELTSNIRATLEGDTLFLK